MSSLNSAFTCNMYLDVFCIIVCVYVFRQYIIHESHTGLKCNDFGYAM
jgi:hypothetical protein